MTTDTDWVVKDMRRLAKREASLQPKKRRKKLTEREQMQRFLTRAEMQRVASGEITPTQFHKYERKMLKKFFGMEVE